MERHRSATTELALRGAPVYISVCAPAVIYHAVMYHAAAACTCDKNKPDHEMVLNLCDNDPSLRG